MAAETSMSETWDYQVFLSFRGPDTRQGFTSCLYNFMSNAGIRVFRDDDELSIGKPMETILLAIENSKICMPVFSPTFASSAWCLREVKKMVDLKKEIIPIFVQVKPNDVKLRTSLYVAGMEKHEKRHGKDQVQQWKDAMALVAGIKGCELKEKGYWEFCKELTKEVQNKLATNKKYVTSHLLGMDEQVDVVLELLDTESGGVRFVGIHGMGGIGKSTLAKVLFNKLSAAFDNSCFLADIRESSGGSNGIENMQRALLGNLGPKLGDMTHNIDLMETIKQKFCKEKVLIVLDDVKDQEQIDKLLGENNCFAPGSRIIVTTRDVRVLQIGGKPFDEIFEVNTMTSTQGMQLFCYHAFRRDSPPHDFKSLSEQVVEHCQGLPLALEVLGSFLCLKDKTVWKDFVDKLNKVLDPTVHGMLRISYEALDIEQQQIFLDIACFFVNTEKSHVAYMWDACGFHPALALDVLVSMSLVKIVEGDKLWMHNLIRDLGRDIARGCGLHQLRNCSRLWGRSSEVMDMLKYKEGKGDITGLRLDGPDPNSTGELFKGLHNLRFLSLEEKNLSRDFHHPLPNLKWLSWQQCPSFNAIHLEIRKLVILELQHSSIDNKWNGWDHIQMEHLKVLDLTSCKKLKCTPDFSNIPNLERLTLSRCTNLVELHGSIIRLKYLKYLNLNYCSSLSKLPDKIGFLKNLEQMYVHGCTGLKKFPNSIGKIKSLIALDLSAGKKDSVNMVISLTNLIQTKSMSSLDKDIDTWILSNFFDPSIMVRAKCVMKLLLDRHKALGRIPGKRFPDIFSNLKVLTKLDISYLLVGSLPESIGNLENLIELNAKRSLLESLPKSIGLLKNLQMLNLAGSHRLAELPIEIGGLSSLRTLNLLGASICLFPPTITKLSLLQSLNLAYCDNFGKAENGFFGLTSQQVKSSDKTQPANALKHFIAPLTGFGCFSQLKVLNLNCQNLECILVLPSSLQQLHLDEFNPRVKLPDVSNIKNLSYLSITFSEEQLKYKNLACLPESLRELRLFDAAALPDISNLKNLRKLVLHGCIYLKEILGLGKLESLEELDICKCQSLDSLANLSELRNLNYLSVIHCPKLSAIEGLDRLALVRKDVHFGNCECKECLSVERETTKRRRILRWVASRMGIPLPDFPLQVRHYTGRYQLVEDLEENYWSN